MRFGSDYKEVLCADGPRYILKKPEKAFSIAAPKWDLRISGLTKYYTNIEASIETGIKKEIQTMIKDLSENFAALQAHYQAVYLTYCTNPCSREAEKNCLEAMAEIRDKEYRLRELEVKTEKLDMLLLEPKKSGISTIKMRKIPQVTKKGIKDFLADNRGEMNFDAFKESINDIRKTIAALKT